MSLPHRRFVKPPPLALGHDKDECFHDPTNLVAELDRHRGNLLTNADQRAGQHCIETLHANDLVTACFG